MTCSAARRGSVLSVVVIARDMSRRVIGFDQSASTLSGIILAAAGDCGHDQISPAKEQQRS